MRGRSTAQVLAAGHSQGDRARTCVSSQPRSGLLRYRCFSSASLKNAFPMLAVRAVPHRDTQRVAPDGQGSADCEAPSSPKTQAAVVMHVQTCSDRARCTDDGVRTGSGDEARRVTWLTQVPVTKNEAVRAWTPKQDSKLCHGDTGMADTRARRSEGTSWRPRGSETREVATSLGRHGTHRGQHRGAHHVACSRSVQSRLGLGASAQGSLPSCSTVEPHCDASRFSAGFAARRWRSEALPLECHAEYMYRAARPPARVACVLLHG